MRADVDVSTEGERAGPESSAVGRQGWFLVRSLARLRGVVVADLDRRSESRSVVGLTAGFFAGEQILADDYSEATILFADIVGFTELASRLTPIELVTTLNRIFSTFDQLAERHGLEKIKTIGDAYMVVAGLPVPSTVHAMAMAEMALGMREAIHELRRPFR